MAVRLRTRWHRSKRSERNREGSRRPKSQENVCSAVAINIWKLAKEAFTRMEKENFRFREDSQAIDVIAEFAIFLLHMVDRMIYGKVPEEERGPLINGIAADLIDTFEGNQIDLLGPGEYRQTFIDKLNERLANYAECSFDEDGPGYDFKRYLAQNCAEIMAITDNKWVLEQVLEIEAPELAERVRPVVRDILGVKGD
jgi:stalled ribosome rescue protein Dom34